MFTSAADVFRKRQAIGDLRAYVRAASDITWLRVAAGLPASSAEPAARAYHRITEGQGCRFRFPRDRDSHVAILLAAALPEDDFPAFLLSTAILLADLLQDSESPDNLFWNWEAFHQQYALADPPVRAALHCGFRAASQAGILSPDPPLPGAACLTLDRASVLEVLAAAGETRLARAVFAEVPAEEAGARWDDASSARLSAAQATGFRYLAERPEGMAPVSPAGAPVVPWSL